MGLLNKESLDNAFGKIKKATSDFISTVGADNSAQDKKYACFCTNCGTGLMNSEKFCHNCGAEVNKKAKIEPEQSLAVPKQNETERKQEYAGKILKCPNCGNPITETTIMCPDCGFQITGRSAVLSVQAFNERLVEIESHKTKTLAGMIGIRVSAIDQADRQKLTLIKTFPIPNTIDDILEFVMLAIANIDVNLSKKLRAAREDLASEMPKAISNAWVLKLQQAYQKAEIMFPDNPIFQRIQKIYFEKMKELKIKVV